MVARKSGDRRGEVRVDEGSKGLCRRDRLGHEVVTAPKIGHGKLGWKGIAVADRGTTMAAGRKNAGYLKVIGNFQRVWWAAEVTGNRRRRSEESGR